MRNGFMPFLALTWNKPEIWVSVNVTVEGLKVTFNGIYNQILFLQNNTIL